MMKTVFVFVADDLPSWFGGLGVSQFSVFTETKDGRSLAFSVGQTCVFCFLSDTGGQKLWRRSSSLTSSSSALTRENQFVSLLSDWTLHLYL